MTRGRLKRRTALAAVASLRIATPVTTCALCERALGRRIEWHHVLPRSHGGRITIPLHPICHRAIHAAVPNADLARHHPDLESLRALPQIARFLAWVGNKSPDFHAPTRRRVGS
jgi:hypothetical protein